MDLYQSSWEKLDTGIPLAQDAEKGERGKCLQACSFMYIYRESQTINAMGFSKNANF